MLAAAAVVGCASGPGEPPTPGSSVGGIPSLRGATVLLLPVQRTVGVGQGADAEMAFALHSRGRDTDWVEPDEIRRAMSSSPAMEVAIDRLPIDMFFRAEVTRVGDPIYGILRRTAALTDAELALIPLAASVREATPERESAIEIMATLIDVRTGYVLWIGTEEGVGDPASPGTLAKAMESLARRIVP